MKKILLLLICINIVTVNFKPVLGDSWDDFRNHEAILFTGQSIKQFIAAPDSHLFVFSYREHDNSWRQITFQLDEIDDKGYFEGEENYNNVIDAVDEFLFMAGDAGDYAPPSSWINDEDSKQYVRYQIEVINPDDLQNKKYVYVFRSSVLTHDPTLPYYIKYIAAPPGSANDTVKTSVYIEGHNSKGIPDWWQLADSNGVFGKNILDRQKARAKGSYVVSYNMDENDLRLQKIVFKRGPIRIIREVTYKAKISLPIGSLEIDVGTFRYRFYPYRIVSLGADKNLQSNYGVKLVRQSFDLDSSAVGMNFNNTDNYDLTIDGIEDTVKDTLYVSPVMNWYMYSGDIGTVVVLNEFTPLSNAKYKLYYHESLTNSTGDGTSDTGDKMSFGDVGIVFTGTDINGSISLPYFNYFLPGNHSREVGSTLAYQAQNRLLKNSSLQNYVLPAELAISLPNTSGFALYPVSIPVRVEDVTDLNVLSFQLAVQFDTLVLAASGVSVINTLVENWNSPLVNISNDTLYVTMEGTTALQDSGVLVYLNFDAIGTEGEQSPLRFAYTKFNTWNPLALSMDGKFTTLPTPEVAVSIPNTFGTKGSEVLIPVKVDDVTGLNITSCTIELQFSKSILDANAVFTDGTLASNWTDVNFTDGVGSLKIEMSGDTALAGSGNLVWINFEVLGKAGQSTDITFKNMVFNQGVPFDKTINGKLTVSSPLLIEAVVSVPDTTIESGNLLSIPIKLSSTTGIDLFGYKIDLTFDAEVLEFQNVDTMATIPPGWGNPSVRYLLGNLSITAEGLSPLTGGGSLIYLNFNVIGSDSSSTVIHFSDLTFNSGTYTASAQDGTVDVQGVVPVELSSFTAKVMNGQVELEWMTATESNNYGFHVQRSADESSQWQTIGFIPGKGTTSSPQKYLFIDEKAGSGTWYYRLQQQDLDGQVNYSNIVEVNILPTKFTLYQNYPNPFNSSTMIKYELPSGEHQVDLIIYDLLGNQVRALVADENQQAGVYQVNWDGRDSDGNVVASGVYFYRLQVGARSFINKLLNLQ